MNWSSVKNVMIFSLLLVNIGLLFTLWGLDTSNETLSDETVSDAVSVLAAHQITVSPEVIPRKSKKMGNLAMVAAVSDHDLFADSFLGKGAQKNTEPDTGTDVYTRGSATVRLNGGYLKYYSGRSPAGTADDAVFEAIEKKLRAVGIRLDNTYSYFDGKNRKTYAENYKGQPFFEGKLSLVADSSGIVSLEGFWMLPTDSQTRENVKPVTEALAQFLNDANRPATPLTIARIKLGYSVLLGESEVNYSQASAIPVWQITTEDHKEYYFDARR